MTEEHYEQPVKGFTRALSVVADDVADDVSRAAANVLEFASLPRWSFPLLILQFWMFPKQAIADACRTCVRFVSTSLFFSSMRACAIFLSPLSVVMIQPVVQAACHLSS